MLKAGGEGTTSQEGGLGWENQLLGSLQSLGPWSTSLMGVVMGSKDWEGGGAAAAAPQPSTDELMAAPPLLLTSATGFGAEMGRGQRLAGSGMTQALFPGSSMDPFRNNTMATSMDKAPEAHLQQIPSSSNDGRNMFSGSTEGLTNQQLYVSNLISSYSRSHDETALSNLVISNQGGASNLVSAAADAQKQIDIASVLLGGSIGSMEGAKSLWGVGFGSIDQGKNKMALFGALTPSIEVARPMPVLFDQSSDSIENVSTFMQVIGSRCFSPKKARALLAHTRPDTPHNGSDCWEVLSRRQRG